MRELWVGFRILLFMTLLTGMIYPLFLTFVAATIAPNRSQGSLLYKDNKSIGSALIAQKFQGNSYFWPRPSAIDYNPVPSGGSNLFPTSQLLKKQFTLRKETLQKQHEGNRETPVDLLFASGSGVDPDISPEAAFYQSRRVALARNMDYDTVNMLIKKKITGRFLGIFGQRRVNVLLLNAALDEQFGHPEKP